MGNDFYVKGFRIDNKYKYKSINEQAKDDNKMEEEKDDNKMEEEKDETGKLFCHKCLQIVEYSLKDSVGPGAALLRHSKCKKSKQELLQIVQNQMGDLRFRYIKQKIFHAPEQFKNKVQQRNQASKSQTQSKTKDIYDWHRKDIASVHHIPSKYLITERNNNIHTDNNKKLHIYIYIYIIKTALINFVLFILKGYQTMEMYFSFMAQFHLW